MAPSSIPTVSADFSADEKMEMENIKMYKKDLLDDIQVNTCRPRKLNKNAWNGDLRIDAEGEKKKTEIFLLTSRS